MRRKEGVMIACRRKIVGDDTQICGSVRDIVPGVRTIVGELCVQFREASAVPTDWRSVFARGRIVLASVASHTADNFPHASLDDAHTGGNVTPSRGNVSHCAGKIARSHGKDKPPDGNVSHPLKIDAA